MRFTAPENKSVVSTLLFLPTKSSYPKSGNLVQFCTDVVQIQHNLIALFYCFLAGSLSCLVQNLGNLCAKWC